MIIGIDGNEANVARKVGIGEYSFAILSHFAKLQTNSTFYIYLKDTPRPDMPKETANWQYILVKPHKLWTQIGLPLYLFSHFPRPSVFFSPSHYAPRFSPVPTAIAIMDVSFLRFPNLFAAKDFYQLKNWTAYSAKHAAKIFTISTASKNDILSMYQKKTEDVIVTYPGIKKTMPSMLTKTELQKKYTISDKYILFVGTLQPRKNITALIEAFSKIKKDDLQLVIIGKKGWLYEEILAAPQKCGVQDSVKFLDFVGDDDLPSFYKYALCYCLPSLYEGFGLPVLEAMQYGCPVITSKVSSLPEAGGDAALYVDPQNVDDIAKQLAKVVSDKNLREKMREKGYLHIKKFSWEKAAKETLAVLEQLGAQNGRA